MDEKLFKKLFVVGSIAILLIIALIIVRPIILSVITGLILAYIFYPIYTRILKVVRERNISALIVVLLIIFIIFIPISFLFPIVTRQVIEAYTYSQKIDFS